MRDGTRARRLKRWPAGRIGVNARARVLCCYRSFGRVLELFSEEHKYLSLSGCLKLMPEEQICEEAGFRQPQVDKYALARINFMAAHKE